LEGLGEMGGPGPAAVEAQPELAAAGDQPGAVCSSRWRSVLGSALASPGMSWSSPVWVNASRSIAVRALVNQTALMA